MAIKQTTERDILRIMTFGAYDLQMLRMQTGLRLTANFRNKLKEDEPEPEYEAEAENQTDKAELSEEAVKLIDELKDSYRRLTDGVARNRTLPEEKGFTGDQLISTFTELVLVDQYIKIEANEKAQFRQLESALSRIPIYSDWLTGIAGIGPAMSAVLISYFDPAKAHHVSCFWAYAGLDVAPDGRGRSRRAEHLIDREYKKKDGTIGTRKSVTYNPWLKSRLLGAMATSFMRQKNCPYKRFYEEYKHRLVTDPNRLKISVGEFKAAYRKLVTNEEPSYALKQPTKEVQEITNIVQVWTPGRIHRAALRYMVKMFLIDFWVKWCTLEGLPITPTYYEAKMGHKHVA